MSAKQKKILHHTPRKCAFSTNRRTDDIKFVNTEIHERVCVTKFRKKEDPWLPFLVDGFAVLFILYIVDQNSSSLIKDDSFHCFHEKNYK